MPEMKLPFFGERHAGIEGDLFKLAAALVVKKRIVHLVVGDENIHPAVQVEVRDSHPHPFAGMGADSGFRRNIPERPIAVIQEQLVGRGLVEFGMAVVAGGPVRPRKPVRF